MNPHPVPCGCCGPRVPTLADLLRTARAEGRRAGLEEAARIVETYTSSGQPARQQIAELIRRAVTR